MLLRLIASSAPAVEGLFGRGFIKFCSGALVVLGMLTMIITALAMFAVVKAGGSTNVGTGAVLGLGVGLMVAAAGFFVGGATYRLASIDERLELAGEKAVIPRPTISSGGNPAPALAFSSPMAVAQRAAIG